MSTKQNRIHSLKIDRFKGIRLVAVDLDEFGSWIPVTGPNGAGKSSLFDAIAYALVGPKWKTAKPIHVGEDKSVIEVKLESGLQITRTITPSGNRLDIIAEDGTPFRGEPQKLLDSIIGKISFDPYEFARWSETPEGRKKQIEAVLVATGKDEESKSLDAEIKDVYDRRRIANTTVEQRQAAVNAIGPVPATTPDAELDVAELSAELEALSASNQESERLLGQIRGNEQTAGVKREQVARCEKEIERLRGELAVLKSELDAIEETGADLFSKSLEIGEPVNVAPQQEALRAKIRDAGAINANVRAQKNRKEKFAELESARKESSTLDERLMELRKQKTNLLKDCELPIEGLAVGEDGLTVKGVPIEEIATSEGIKLSAALCRAMSPNFPVIFIRDASLLDRDSRKWFKDFADEHDLQIFIELVGQKAPANCAAHNEGQSLVGGQYFCGCRIPQMEEVGIYLEDGEAR